METESKDLIDFYEDILKEAAGFKLMVNFHGANKPTGESRTYPNEMTREGVRGLEWNKSSTLPRQFYATIPFTRYLAGHGDFTPCTFNPEFLKGTTFTMQLASVIMYTSPVMHWPDRPKLYFASPALEIIKKIPSTWDETIVLEGSKIGELAAFARRKGNEWFVAIINGSGEQRFYELDTSFLDKDLYKVIAAKDVINKSAEMNVETMMIKSGDTLPIQMNPGGGFVAHFSTNIADMKWWRDGRFGMFIHWGPVSIKGTEIGWSRGKQIPVERQTDPCRTVRSTLQEI